MARPTSGTTIQRADLGALAYEYMITSSQAGFIASQILPIFPVTQQSADYPVIPIEALLKLPASIRRSARGAYQRGDYEFETGTYSCEEYGWEEPVDDSEARLYQRFFDAEEVATIRATDMLLRHYEKRVAAMVFNTSNITNYTSVSTEWSTASSCTPKADVKTAIQAMRAATGLEPDTIVMSKKVFENLLVCSELKSYLQYTAPHLMANFQAQKQIVAQYLGLEEVIIGGAMYDSAGKNIAYSLADIWDDEYVLLFKKGMGVNNLREPSLGRTFLWTADSPQILTTESYREEQTRSNIYRVRHYVDEAFIFTGAGYLLANITA